MHTRTLMTDERVCRCSLISSVESSVKSMESRMRRHEGCEDRRPVTSFLLLDTLEP
jgi:hypothetical protein